MTASSTNSLSQPFLDLLQNADRFLLSGHEHPDGDCIGSQIGLYHLCKAMGKQVEILNPDPVARSLEFMQEGTPIGDFKTSRRIPEFDVLILLDCAELGRLSELGRQLRERQPQIAVLDHHVGSESGDGSIAYVDSRAPATGALVYNLYAKLGVKIEPVAAEGLFVSLVSDTGWFRYSNADAGAFAMATDLVRQGVQADVIFDRLFRQNDSSSVPLLAESLATQQARFQHQFLYAVMEKDLMMRSGRAGFDTDQVLEPMRSVQGVQVVGIFKELIDGRVKLSLRSSHDVDVQAITAVFGGGGHKKAAGATIPGPLTHAIAAVEREVEKALDQQQDRGEQ